MNSKCWPWIQWDKDMHTQWLTQCGVAWAMTVTVTVTSTGWPQGDLPGLRKVAPHGRGFSLLPPSSFWELLSPCTFVPFPQSSSPLWCVMRKELKLDPLTKVTTEAAQPWRCPESTNPLPSQGLTCATQSVLYQVEPLLAFQRDTPGVTKSMALKPAEKCGVKSGSLSSCVTGPSHLVSLSTSIFVKQ